MSLVNHNFNHFFDLMINENEIKLPVQISSSFLNLYIKPGVSYMHNIH